MDIDDYQRLVLGAFCEDFSLNNEHIHKLDATMFSSKEERKILVALQDIPETRADLVESLDGVHHLKVLKTVLRKFGKYGPRDVKKWVGYLSNNALRRDSELIVEETARALKLLKSTDNPADVLTALSSKIITLGETGSGLGNSGGFSSFDEIADEVKSRIGKTVAGKAVDRVKTGFPKLDKKLKGGIPFGLTIIGGTPGSGKTQKLLQIIRNQAQEAMDQVMLNPDEEALGVFPIFSVEMTKEKLVERLVQSDTGLEIKEKLSLRKMKRINEAIENLRVLPIVIDDSSILNIDLIYNRLHLLNLKYKRIRAIGIDFVELLVEDDGNMEQLVGRIYVRCALLAKIYSCPVYLITHLSRAFEQSNTKVPGMNDIRYSRLAEAMATLILLIYAPYEYHVKGKYIRPPKNMPAIEGVNYVIIEKHREGKTGINIMGWTGECTRWSDEPIAAGMYTRVDNPLGG